MPVLTVNHVTTYSYRRVVGFGEHRMLFRPRDSADQRLLSWELEITPKPIELRSIPDAFGNTVTLARFAGRARELTFENRLVIHHTPTTPSAERLAPYARSWPFTYDKDDTADLARVRERHYEDSEHTVDAWARSFLQNHPTGNTLDLLVDITQEIRRGFTYSARYEEGVQEPARTLALRNGTCRDYAVLMMEAVRALGMAARFVSGYVYSPGSDGIARIGGGSTHAWVEVYLPGCGWTEFDPTNGIVGSRDLIRVASVRDWHQAVPLAGTWTGFPADSIGMKVSVSVGRRDQEGSAETDRDGDTPDGEAFRVRSRADIVQISSRESSGGGGTRPSLDRSAAQAG
ncbi:transglutaminase family protein [Lichenicola sp.]|uniref:transglutaminase family protein n=1 Tax=Lichenicola sp. TaxID=2804529 RepID=UPI003B00433D